MLNQIKNFVQLTDDIGTSGQPTEAQFEEIAEAGCAAVVNLALPDSKNAIPSEGGIVTALGMAYIHIPVPFDNPTQEHLGAFIKVMDAFEGKNKWAHCVVNYRVSAFMYHYLRIRRNYTDSDARSPIFDIWKPDDVWQRFLEIPKIA